MDEVFREAEGERGDAVDDDEGVSDDRCLHRGGSAGDDAGTGVVKGFAGAGDEVSERLRTWAADASACR
jgi:hypothetical protein